MKVHVIGSGCPDARPDRYGSAFVLEIGDDSLLNTHYSTLRTAPIGPMLRQE